MTWEASNKASNAYRLAWDLEKEQQELRQSTLEQEEILSEHTDHVAQVAHQQSTQMDRLACHLCRAAPCKTHERLAREGQARAWLLEANR